MTPRHNQYTGCALGLALGDATAAPIQGATGEQARAHAARCAEDDASELPGLEVEGEPQPFGQITRHTQLAQALLQALVDCGAALRREHLARVLRRLVATRGLVHGSRATLDAITRLARGTPWLYAGAPPPCVEADPLARAPFIGLALHARPEALAPVAVEQTLLTHNNPITSAAAVAVAEATRRALSDAPTPRNFDLWQAVAEAADSVPHVIVCDDTVHTTLGALILDLFTHDSPDFDPATHGDTLDWLQTLRASPEGLPDDAAIATLWAFRAFWLAPEAPLTAIAHALWPGGHTSTAAAITGALAGARAGLPALPQPLVLALHDRGDASAPDLLRLARTLFDQATSGDD